MKTFLSATLALLACVAPTSANGYGRMAVSFRASYGHASSYRQSYYAAPAASVYVVPAPAFALVPYAAPVCPPCPTPAPDVDVEVETRRAPARVIEKEVVREVPRAVEREFVREAPAYVERSYSSARASSYSYAPRQVERRQVFRRVEVPAQDYEVRTVRRVQAVREVDYVPVAARKVKSKTKVRGAAVAVPVETVEVRAVEVAPRKVKTKSKTKVK